MTTPIAILGGILVAIISGVSGFFTAWLRTRVDHSTVDHARIDRLESRLDTLEGKVDARNSYIDDLRAHINAGSPPPPPPYPWLLHPTERTGP